MSTGSRKDDHLRINVDRSPLSGVDSGFSRYRFIHNALPEIDLADVSTETRFLGKALSAPLLVSCMTGGTPRAGTINATLARVAQRFGFALGLGSARALLEDPSSLPSFDVRAHAPDVLLLANIGAVQLNYGVDAPDCRRLVEMLHADALVLHLNPLQEALQPEGDTNFGGLLRQIERLCAALKVPVIVKEVGWGLDAAAARALHDAGVAALDVAGAGGTSWSEVERHRANGARAIAAASFRDWGIPTAECVAAVRRAVPEAAIIASGGISDGCEAAKAIALGADVAGIARPFLLAADRGDEAAMEFADALLTTLRIAMFSIGVRSIGALRETTRLQGA
jgi:isopentenyl-diphosphate delta-isomerase